MVLLSFVDNSGKSERSVFKCLNTHTSVFFLFVFIGSYNVNILSVMKRTGFGCYLYDIQFVLASANINN